MALNSKIIARMVDLKLSLYVLLFLLSPLAISQQKTKCPGVDVIHADNIDFFRGCAIVQGSVTILDTSFSGFQQIFPNFTFGKIYPKMHPSKLEAFASLQEVTGYVRIEASHPDFTDLTFFQNLQVIGGRELTENFCALYIVKTSLESLNLQSLKQVSSGGIVIRENEKLCFANTINYCQIMKSPSKIILVHSNANDTFCNTQSGDLPDENEMCWSSDCIKTAGDVLMNMQLTTDLCSDFYNFACGNYGREPGKTSSVSKRSTESVYFLLKNILESDDQLEVDGLHDVKSFYNTCVQFGSYSQDVYDTGESLLKLMTDLGIGIWPSIDPLYDSSGFSLERTLARLILLDVPVVFKMEIEPDDHVTSNYLMKISPGGPRESGRSSDDIKWDMHLRLSVRASFFLLGAPSMVNVDVDDLLSVDAYFATIEQDKKITCDDVTRIAPEEAASELNRLVPEIKWDIVLAEIRRATGLRQSFAVKLHCKQKIRDYLALLVKDLSFRSEANYLSWRFFSKFVEHVIPTFSKSHFGAGEAVPRWRHCLQLMEGFASPVFSDVLTHKMMNKEIKEKVEWISSSALSATQRLVSSASWLSDPQKAGIREKVARIRIRYPFQKKDLNGTGPIRIPHIDVSNFTEVVIMRQRQSVIERFRRLGQDADGVDTFDDCRTPVLSARSESLPGDSTAYIYFDKMTSPYIRRHGSQWLHFGGFGVSIAREILRVLMSTNGGKSEREGSKLWKIWWQHTRNSSTCLERSHLSNSGSDEKDLQSEETENFMQNIFLDQSSLEIAYETLTDFGSLKSYALPGLEFEKDKIFFLGYAQTLCDADSSSGSSKNNPVKDRVNAVLNHFETFDRVFGCGSSSLQCTVWA